MIRFGYAFRLAAALLGLAGMLQPAKATTTIVYTLTADDPRLGGPLDFSFPSAGFLAPPVGNETLTISNATTCFVAGGPCTKNPIYFNTSLSTPSISILLANGAAESGLLASFLTAEFGAIGTYQSIDDLGLVTMTVSAVATPEPSTWAMLLIGFSGLGFAGYRKAGAVRAVRADLM
jgi:PEP-CTERM motif